MKYIEIIVNCKGAEHRLSRKLLIKHDVDLLTLGYIVLCSLNAELDKEFIIYSNHKYYTYNQTVYNFHHLPKDFEFYIDLEDSGISDLNDTFEILYPDMFSEDYWSFTCTITNKNITKNSKHHFIIEEVNGLGLWEDSSDEYFRYVRGEYKPNMRIGTLESKNGLVPWNLNLRNLKDTDEFDKDRLIASMNSETSEDLIDDIEDYCEMLDYDPLKDPYNDYGYGDDYDDFDGFDEYDEMDVKNNLFGTILYSVMLQIDTVDWVHDVYERLMDIYQDQEYVMMMISKEFLDIFMQFLDPNNISTLKEYKKRLEKLK